MVNVEYAVSWFCLSKWFFCIFDSKPSDLFLHYFNISVFLSRIWLSCQHIEIEGFLDHKKNLNMHLRHQQLFMWGICPFTQQKSKFMSFFPALEKSRKSSWVWIRTRKHPAAFVLFCKTLVIYKWHSWQENQFFHVVIFTKTKSYIQILDACIWTALIICLLEIIKPPISFILLQNSLCGALITHQWVCI